MNDFLKKFSKESFKHFYERYSRPLWLFILKNCSDESAADDIFQDSFYKFLRANPFKLDESQQKAYLYKIAYNLIIDRSRSSKNRHLELEDQAVDKSREQEIFFNLDMDKTLKLLKKKERNLLWLAYVEGYSHSEIAKITSAREKSIRVQLFRTKKKFIKILNQHGYTGEEIK